jgi:hypothetical protein
MLSKFGANKLARLARVCDDDFLDGECEVTRSQLKTFTLHVRKHPTFLVVWVRKFSHKVIETQKDMGFPLVYKFIELNLLLPPAGF